MPARRTRIGCLLVGVFVLSILDFRDTALARPAHQVSREGKSQSQSKSEKVEGARPKASFELWQSQKKAWASESELSTESVRVVVRYAERGNGTVGTKRLKRREAKAAAMRCPIRSPRSVLVRRGISRPLRTDPLYCGSGLATRLNTPRHWIGVGCEQNGASGGPA